MMHLNRSTKTVLVALFEEEHKKAFQVAFLRQTLTVQALEQTKIREHACPKEFHV